MRWNCPHCQTSLQVAISLNQVSEQGAFVRCSSCRGVGRVLRKTKSAAQRSTAPSVEPSLAEAPLVSSVSDLEILLPNGIPPRPSFLEPPKRAVIAEPVIPPPFRHSSPVAKRIIPEVVAEPAVAVTAVANAIAKNLDQLKPLPLPARFETRSDSAKPKRKERAPNALIVAGLIAVISGLFLASEGRKALVAQNKVGKGKMVFALKNAPEQASALDSANRAKR